MPSTCTSVPEEVTRLLRSLSGVRAAAGLAPGDRPRLFEAERSFEEEAAVPVLNAGMREALEREHTVAVLKDSAFRPPPIPTIYLVEESGGPPVPESLLLEGRNLHIIGEELLDGSVPRAPGGVMISDTFVMYPERRRDPSRPAWFLLPPVPFPELESSSCAMGIRRVVSSSPSARADEVVRRMCGFPSDPALATLLIGFDLIGFGLEGVRAQAAHTSS